MGRSHGLLLTLAPGGTLAELMLDKATLLLPASRAEVAATLTTLRYAKVLNGYRGSRPCDMEAILDAVMAVQSFALAEPAIEIEINPLLCGQDFAIAADALIVLGDADD